MNSPPKKTHCRVSHALSHVTGLLATQCGIPYTLSSSFFCLLLIILWPVPGLAEIPGRLFMSHDERIALQQQRQHDAADVLNLATPRLNVNGIVRRSEGKATLWINQQALHDPDGSASIRLSRDGQKAILQIDKSRKIELKPGACFDRHTGEILDLPKSQHCSKDKQHALSP